MRLKQVSKRRWKARLRQGRWVPRMVVEIHSLTAPEGMKLVWHPEEDFIRIMPQANFGARDYHPDDTKRAWNGE